MERLSRPRACCPLLRRLQVMQLLHHLSAAALGARARPPAPRGFGPRPLPFPCDACMHATHSPPRTGTPDSWGGAGPWAWAAAPAAALCRPGPLHAGSVVGGSGCRVHALHAHTWVQCSDLIFSWLASTTHIFVLRKNFLCVLISLVARVP